MQAEAAYDELVRRARERSLLSSCASLLKWDEETYMPTGGARHRGEQMALLAGLLHERATDPRVGDLLSELEHSGIVCDVGSPREANVRELRRLYNRATRLPRSLVQEIARTTSLAQQEWVVARRNSDFAHFRPWLEKIVSLKRCEADALGYEDAAYDALLEEYEPGARSRTISELFAALREHLLPLLGAIAGAQRAPDVAILHREFPIDRQRVFGETVAAALGFDFTRGRLDTAAHPSCSGIGPGDSRITTRFSVNDFTDGLFSILHELGHALYEQGLDPAHYGTPAGEPVSLGVHESQSRLWENTVGRSRAFWTHFFPLAHHVFHGVLDEVSPDDFHFAVNAVQPSLIRVQADEVTYNLHTLVRFDLEQALLSDDLRVSDIPAAWNDSYARYLGVTPANDAEGSLQDGHWSAGLIGYFPTYTLGNVFAAQLFAKATEELGDLNDAFARGDFAELLGWLRDRVHRHGSCYPASQLIERVTGSPPDHRPLMDALWEKYGELYGVGSRIRDSGIGAR